jgi:hypothetical protein
MRDKKKKMHASTDVLKDANYGAQTAVMAALSLAYNDVFLREPTQQEAENASSPALLTLEGILQLYRFLLISPEFFSCYVFNNSPIAVARLLTNQLFGRGPSSMHELEIMAIRGLELGWLGFINELLTQPELNARILHEVRFRLGAVIR